MSIKQTFVGDASKLTGELDRVNRAYAQLEQKLQNVTNESEKSANAGDRQMSTLMQGATSAAGQVASLAASYVSLTVIIDQVTQAMDRQRQVEQDNLSMHERLAKAQAELIRNMGPSIGAATQQIAAIQQETGVGRVPLTEAASFAVSSKAGDITNQQAISAMGAAAKLVPDRPEALTTYTQAALQVMAASGISDPTQALGFIQSGIGISSIADPSLFAENVAPAIFAGTIQDKTDPLRAARESAALFTTMTKFGETGGALSSTATITMSEQLGSFFRGRADDPGSLFGRLGVLQEDARVRDQFLAKGKLQGPAQLRTVMGDLLDPTSDASRTLREIAPQLQFDAAPYEARVGAIATATPSLAIAERLRRGTAAEERQQIDRSDASVRTAAAQLLEQGLNASSTNVAQHGVSFLESWGNYFRAAFASPDQAPGIASGYLETRLGALEAGGVTPQERPQVEALRSMIEELRQLRQDVRAGQGQVITGAANAQPSRHQE